MVKLPDDLLLQMRLQVDQQVAAGDQIDVEKQRVPQQVMPGEDDLFANAPVHLETVCGLNEVLGAAFKGHLLHRRRRIDPFASNRDGGFVEVGDEDLNAAVRQDLRQGHCQRVGLFARGATRNPDTERIRDNLRVAFLHGAEQRIEGERVAEERGHRDQTVMGQLLDLFVVFIKKAEVGRIRRTTRCHQALLNPACDRVGLVAAEVNVRRDIDPFENLIELRTGMGRGRGCHRGATLIEVGADVLGRQHGIDRGGRERPLRHGRIFGRFRILHNHGATR